MSACVSWAPEWFLVMLCNAEGFLDADGAVGIAVVTCNINYIGYNQIVCSNLIKVYMCCFGPRMFPCRDPQSRRHLGCRWSGGNGCGKL
jgi:hypothetical protein